MNLNDVHRGIQKNKSRKRIGRGPGSGHGKTATRGHKGQGSRSGSSTSPIFEGGQMPLVRRIPKRGFHNRLAETVAIVNLDVLERNFQSGEEVTPEALRGKALRQRKLRPAESAGQRGVDQEPEDFGAPVQPFGAGEDRKGRRAGGRPARQEARGQEQDESEEPEAVGRRLGIGA